MAPVTTEGLIALEMAELSGDPLTLHAGELRRWYAEVQDVVLLRQPQQGRR
jgi:hypothetical protein